MNYECSSISFEYSEKDLSRGAFLEVHKIRIILVNKHNKSHELLPALLFSGVFLILRLMLRTVAESFWFWDTCVYLIPQDPRNHKSRVTAGDVTLQDDFIFEYSRVIMVMTRVQKNAFAYSMTTLAATLMNWIFNFYYVKIFLNVYR